MNHLPSIIDFLTYFGLGFVAFVILLQLLRTSGRLSFHRLFRKWFRNRTTPVFVEVYRPDPQTSPVSRVSSK